MDIAEYKRAVIDLRPVLLILANRITRNSEDAEDVVQEVCLKLWHRCRTCGDPDNLEAYCVTMTRNLSVDKIRKRRPEGTEAELMHTEEEAYLPDKLMEIKEEHALIHRIISLLPPLQRQILRMKEIDGYETEEIVEITGIAAEAVRNNLSRARRRLREQYLMCRKKSETFEYLRLREIKQEAL